MLKFELLQNGFDRSLRTGKASKQGKKTFLMKKQVLGEGTIEKRDYPRRPDVVAAFRQVIRNLFQRGA